MSQRRFIIAAAVALIVAMAAFFIYAGQYDAAGPEAAAALISGDGVTVTPTSYGWHFDGPADDRALIFYPGAKVAAEAYAPFLRRLAASGLDACLVRMPFRLALFGKDRAAAVMGRHDYPRWVVGGHSLGGAMAALYAAEHPEDLRGLVLCAAYPTKPLPENLTVVTLYGSNDGVLNRQRLEEDRKYLPPGSVTHVIEGGNHAGFGDYGPQKGDGPAAIDASAQQAEAARVILEALAGRVIA